jgi:hypothetical protein
MTSALLQAALSRRFFIGPLVALAFAGASPAVAPVVAPTSSATASPAASPTAAVDLARRAILRAHEAEAVYYVDNLVYAAGIGNELTALRGIEPTIRWGTEVIVELPKEEVAEAEVVILRAPIPSGGSLCMSEVSEIKDAGTWFARVTGRKRCPPRKPGMPGWTEDQAKGWGA